MRILFIAMSLCATACAGSDASTAYSFPGCDDASSGQCHADGVFACASRTIAEKFDGCSVDDDCVVANAGSNSGTFSCTVTCPVAVRAEQAGNYNDEIANERQRYCTSSDECGGFMSCDNSGFSVVAACASGHCVLEPVDAGF